MSNAINLTTANAPGVIKDYINNVINSTKDNRQVFINFTDSDIVVDPDIGGNTLTANISPNTVNLIKFDSSLSMLTDLHVIFNLNAYSNKLQSDYAPEYRLLFIPPIGIFNLVLNGAAMNAAYNTVEFIWADGEPTWSTDTVYEISLLPVEIRNDKLIVCALYKQYTSTAT